MLICRLKLIKPAYSISKIRGISILELLCVLSILTIIFTFAISFNHWLDKQTIIQHANSLLIDMQYAKNSAQAFHQNTSICISDDQKNCSTTGDLFNWNRGWIIFRDPIRSFKVKNASDILRSHQSFSEQPSIISNGSHAINFSGRNLFAVGIKGLSASTITICIKHHNKYEVKIDAQGFARIIEPTNDINNRCS